MFIGGRAWIHGRAQFLLLPTLIVNETPKPFARSTFHSQFRLYYSFLIIFHSFLYWAFALIPCRLFLFLFLFYPNVL